MGRVGKRSCEGGETRRFGRGIERESKGSLKGVERVGEWQRHAEKMGPQDRARMV